jgi:hypothetical protein
MSERDQIYIQILQYGLLSLRNAGLQGMIEYCAIEAEHLHNLPTLIGESNERRHEYYFERERPCYLEQVDRSVPGLDFTLRRYEECWRELRDLTEPSGPEP